MLQSLRKTLAVPHLPVQSLVVAGTVVSFFWLLVQDLVHPLMVLLLQLYLAF